MLLNSTEIEKTRKYFGYSQKTFSKIIGVKLATYKNLIKSGNFRTNQLIKISETLKINIEDLFIYDKSNYQINTGDNSQIVNEGKARYGKRDYEKLKKENRELKKEVKYLKEIIELLRNKEE